MPRLCLCCQEKIENGFLCDSCLSSIQRVPPDKIEEEFHRKFFGKGLVNEFSSVFYFEESGAFQRLVYEMKYSGMYAIGSYFGAIIASELREKIESWNAEAVIPVPLYGLKRRERGFNQSYYIAKEISKTLNFRFSPNALRRVVNTKSQTGLSVAERTGNMNGAFRLKRRFSVPKRIILVDDVITTGATLSECASVLRKAGAESIFCLTAGLTK